jgi:hypothetical protein
MDEQVIRKFLGLSDLVEAFRNTRIFFIFKCGTSTKFL